MADGQQVTLGDLKGAAESAKDALWNAANGIFNGEPHIYLHWSAGSYDQKYSEYHVNITGDGTMYLMADLDAHCDHTWCRNTGSVAISLCACAGATENDLGSYAPTEAQVNAMAQATAVVAAGLGIPVDKAHVLTHGEAAAEEDGYDTPGEGCKYALWDHEQDDGDYRWDLEVLGCCGSTTYNPSATDGTRGGDIIRTMAGGVNTGGITSATKLDEKSQKVQDLINWCVNTANDNSHLYVFGAAGPDNFDCTGFISYGMNQVGYDIQPCHGDAFDSGVIACGWESLDYNDSMGTDALQPGDILDCDNHVELYIGGGQVVGAHSSSKPPADQISVEGWFADGWTNILRCPGISGVKGPNGKSPNSRSGPSSNAYMANIKDDGHSLEIMPQKKTYCEPLYPDLVYVAGNIPCSPIEQTLIERSGSMDKSGTLSLMTSQTTRDLTGIDGNAFTGSKAMEQAQRAFDPTKAQLEVKVPSAGKPLNNNDAFPVDLKIEELERHLPRVKQYKIGYDRKIGATKETIAALLHVSDYAEKRIVRLENNVATLMRYIFAMGSRIAINCQYYGGQDHRSWNLAA